ncbi:MAG: metallophosphoesterase [Firmicutes bacterium]|nr:metallophosphoesterase [Bacillota bacterium]
MKIFAIGDLHLSLDERIEKPMDIFGSRWANHHTRIKEHWEELVGPDDVVVIPGDISWGLRENEALADLEWISNLPGRKILTKGNHDLWWTSVSRLNKLHENMTFLQNKCIMVSDKVGICGSRGWVCPGTDGFTEHDRKIYNREVLRLGMSLKEAKDMGAETIIAALHYPPTNDAMQGSGFTDLLEEYGVKTCIYGHLHGKDAFKNGIKGILNSVEYKLVSFDYLEGKPEFIYSDEINDDKKEG